MHRLCHALNRYCKNVIIRYYVYNSSEQLLIQAMVSHNQATQLVYGFMSHIFYVCDMILIQNVYSQHVIIYMCLTLKPYSDIIPKLAKHSVGYITYSFSVYSCHCISNANFYVILHRYLLSTFTLYVQSKSSHIIKLNDLFSSHGRG
jgi:hypothetical protein